MAVGARVRPSSRPARGEAPRARVVEIQRSRLLGAALRAVGELGYARTTVAHVTSRARVSRRTFYDLFENREDCLLAALESIVEQVKSELAEANLDAMPWRERVRTGLWVILSFLDREPVLARVCVVQALRGGPRVLERREQVLAELAGVINKGCEGVRGTDCPSLTAEGLVGAAFTIVYGRLLRGEHEPLTSVFKELMGMIVLPYQGAGVARRERVRKLPVKLQSSELSGPEIPCRPVPRSGFFWPDGTPGPAMRLTYRTARVLETIAERSGVSNRQAGELAGISDQGQISKLLSRLKRLGLIENTGEGHAQGEANSWTLTTTGLSIAQSIRAHAPQDQETTP